MSFAFDLMALGEYLRASARVGAGASAIPPARMTLAQPGDKMSPAKEPRNQLLNPRLKECLKGGRGKVSESV